MPSRSPPSWDPSAPSPNCGGGGGGGRLQRAVDNPAVLVVARGQILESGMASTGLSLSDVRSTLRTAWVSSLDDVTALVFEPTGDLSVVTAPVDELDPWLFEAISGTDALGLPVQ